MIQKLLTLVKGLPWWAWVLVGLAVLYLFNIASGSIYSRKLWSMLHDQIVQTRCSNERKGPTRVTD